MRNFPIRTSWCGIGVLTLAACTPELPKFARELQVPASVKSAAIPLERALQEKMLEATPISTQSTRTEMAILLKPLVSSQPWIRIDPGWVAENKEFSQVAFVTTQTIYARLPKRKDFQIRVRHVRLHWTRSSGMPSDSNLVQNTDDSLVHFLHETGDGDEDPHWKILQIAVWALTDDISYASVKPPVEGSQFGFRGNHQYATADQIQQVMNLLAVGGHDRDEFNLWKTMTTELDHEVIAYDNYCDIDAAKAFIPFKKICHFYPLDTAADVLFSVFDRHDGPEGKSFRRYAVDVLGEQALSKKENDQEGNKEIELLKQRASYEDDPEILKAMRLIIAGYEKGGGSSRTVASPGK